MAGAKKIVGGIIAVLVVLIVGIGGLAYMGWGMVKEQATVALNGNAVIQQYIGEITEIELDLEATGELEGGDSFAFRVQGEKGRGLVSGEFVTVDAERESLRSGTLRLSTGEEYDIMVPPPKAGESGTGP